MKHLINDQKLVPSVDQKKSSIPSSNFKIYSSIIGKVVLVVLASILSFSISFAQNDTLTSKRDITKMLRANHKKNTVDDVKKIPVETRNVFFDDFGDVTNVIWKVEPGYNEVDFIMKDKPMMAFFDYDDELIGSGYYIDYMGLPEKGRARITKDYGAYIPEKTMFFQDNEDNESDFLNFYGNFLKDEAYFVLLRDEDKEIVVQVDKDGEVSYFSDAKKE